MSIITVWNNGRSIHVFADVAAQLGLTDGQTIDKPTAFRVIDLNTAVLRAREEARPARNPVIRQLVADCLDATEISLARHYSRSESRS